MRGGPFLARRERFGVVGSTNDIVRAWLADGTPEVCLAVADEQSAGRGREGRAWSAPAGAALLLSLGFRPASLAPERTWRLAASVALAMADAAEETAGLRDGAIRLKWPNDLVVEAPDRGPAGPGLPGAAAAVVVPGLPEPGWSSGFRKLGGILGETEGLGTPDPRVVVGIGVNADWPAADFPAAMAPTMTSLREASGGRPIDREALLEAFLARLEPRVLVLGEGRFDVGGWHERQLTTGRLVRLELPGQPPATVRAVGVDGASGALLVADPTVPGAERAVLAGEVVRVRLEPDPAPGAAAGV